MITYKILRGLSPKQVLLIVITGIIFIGASFQVIEAQPEFCKSCHEMEFYYNTWVSSTHFSEVDCLGCHTEPGITGFIETKIRGTTELIVHITGDYEVPIQPGVRIKNPQCLKCHLDVEDILDTKVYARHDLHTENNVLCVDCHIRLVHSTNNELKIIQTNECEKCHNDHRDFSIQGRHALLACSECHPGEVYEVTSILCQDCHDVPPDHTEGIYSNCEACHTDSDWSLIGFDHITIALKGGHSNLSCLNCHQADSYHGLSPDCESCHVLPVHHLPAQDQTCIECHTVNSWSPAEFDHTVYELSGKHVRISCKECHIGGQYEGTSALCEDCHNAPAEHIMGINETCEVCHTVDNWNIITFYHEVFSLTEGHQNVSCSDCHEDKEYDMASNLCESCHGAPIDHAVNMDTECGLCHTTAGWSPAEFDHSSYPLTGAHRAVSCIECHIEEVFTGAPSDCVACHSEPTNHRGLNRDCSQCHSTSTFSPSTYKHTRIAEHFPGGRGDEEERLNCNECHRITYAAFSCMGSGCHSTNYPKDD